MIRVLLHRSAKMLRLGLGVMYSVDALCVLHKQSNDFALSGYVN